MRIIFKHTLKNIFKKPFRMLLMVFCLFSCAFVALLSLDMSGALDSMIGGFMGSFLGKAEMDINGTDIEETIFNDEKIMSENTLKLYSTENNYFDDLKDQYTFVHKETIYITGLDLDAGRDMEIVTFEKTPSADEAVVSEFLAERFGYKVGDTIKLYDELGDYHDYKIVEIPDLEKTIFGKYGVCLNIEGYSKLVSEVRCDDIVVDVKDKDHVLDTVNYVKDNYPNATVNSVYGDVQTEFICNIITKLMFTLFAICVLMVIFVAISVSERIIAERMSVVGTLRSVGVSAGTTMVILLLENIFYGVVGSGLACLLYNAIRDPMLNVVIGESDDFGSMNGFFYLLVMIASVAVVCLCPLKEIIKAANTPIRDLIFANKDTEYKFSKSGTIAGIICAILGIVIFFVPANFYLCFVQLGLFVFALSMLYPHFQVFAGKLIYKLFDKLEKPIAKLAATELYTKKSTVACSVLITTALALVLVVNLVGTALSGVIGAVNFTSDVCIETNGDKETSFFRFVEDIEGVTDVEYIYGGSEKFEINGKVNEDTAYIGVPEGGIKYYKIVSGAVPLEYDEVSLGEQVAKLNNVKVGDTIEVKFNCEGYYPVTKQLKVMSLCDFSSRDISGLDILISEKLCKELCGDYPKCVNINCEDPDAVDEFIEDNIGGNIASCRTQEQYKEEGAKATGGFIGVIDAVMVFGVIIAFIGATSSLLIGFDGRKRECAVLCSTSMPRKKMNRMLFLESFFSSGLAALMAIPAGILMMEPVKTAFTFMSMHLKIISGMSSFVYLMFIFWFVFTLTSLFPMRALKKMKLAEQLKYE